MSDEKYANKVLGHEYDGIQEYDNPLPAWWTWLSIITVILGIGYVFYMHMGMGGLLQEDELKQEIAQAEEKWPNLKQQGDGAAAAPAFAAIDESKYKGNPDAIAAGREIFVMNCSPCHKADATGDIGPNLTDKTWIHGGKYNDIRHTITMGVPVKGMVTWGGVLPDEQIAQVAAYVHSLGGGED